MVHHPSSSVCGSCEEVLDGDLSLGQLLFDSDSLLEAEVRLHGRVHQLILSRENGAVAI